MEELSSILRKATEAIEADYFHLHIDGGAPVYRERVYSYELYHQMRARWPIECLFRLNGEVDKRAHPILRQRGVGALQPDLLVHGPGSMNRNHAIIEIKSSDAGTGGIRKDLTTLATFMNSVNYERAIYLIYGSEINQALLARIVRISQNVDRLPRIEVWLHHAALTRAEHCLSLNNCLVGCPTAT